MHSTTAAEHTSRQTRRVARSEVCVTTRKKREINSHTFSSYFPLVKYVPLHRSSYLNTEEHNNNSVPVCVCVRVRMLQKGEGNESAERANKRKERKRGGCMEMQSVK